MKCRSLGGCYFSMISWYLLALCMGITSNQQAFKDDRMIGLTLSKPSTKLPKQILKSDVWEPSYSLNILKKNSLFAELIALYHHFSQLKLQLSWLPKICFKGIVGQTCSESLQSWGIGYPLSCIFCKGRFDIASIAICMLAWFISHLL